MVSTYTSPDFNYTENGQWGQWSVWTCTHSCGWGKIVRTRMCNDPPPLKGGLPCQPPNASEQRSPDDCRLHYCPHECGFQSWGLDCNMTCFNCFGDCDKNSGSCSLCLAGYFNPPEGPLNCSVECPEMTYGYECRGSCYNKCSKECLDKQLGTCDDVVGIPFIDKGYYYYFMYLIIVPVLTVLSELLKFKEEVDDRDENVHEQGRRRGRTGETLARFFADFQDGNNLDQRPDARADGSYVDFDGVDAPTGEGFGAFFIGNLAAPFRFFGNESQGNEKDAEENEKESAE